MIHCNYMASTCQRPVNYRLLQRLLCFDCQRKTYDDCFTARRNACKRGTCCGNSVCQSGTPLEVFDILELYKLESSCIESQNSSILKWELYTLDQLYTVL